MLSTGKKFANRKVYFFKSEKNFSTSHCEGFQQKSLVIRQGLPDFQDLFSVSG